MNIRLLCCVLCVAVAVTGCGGAAVAVRSDFSRHPETAHAPPPGAPLPGPRQGVAKPAPAPPPHAAAPHARFSGGPGRAAAGFSYSTDHGFAIAIVLSLMLADGVYWVATKFKHAFGEPERTLEAAPERR